MDIIKQRNNGNSFLSPSLRNYLLNFCTWKEYLILVHWAFTFSFRDSGSPSKNEVEWVCLLGPSKAKVLWLSDSNSKLKIPDVECTCFPNYADGTWMQHWNQGLHNSKYRIVLWTNDCKFDSCLHEWGESSYNSKCMCPPCLNPDPQDYQVRTPPMVSEPREIFLSLNKSYCLWFYMGMENHYL